MTNGQINNSNNIKPAFFPPDSEPKAKIWLSIFLNKISDFVGLYSEVGAVFRHRLVVAFSGDTQGVIWFSIIALD